MSDSVTTGTFTQGKYLSAENIAKSFGTSDCSTRAVFKNVSIRVTPGTIVGLRGNSGVGKSTLGRILAGLDLPDSGNCMCDGMPIGHVRKRTGQHVRGQIGMIFQSPRRSCDPRMTLRRTIRSTGSASEMQELVSKVGLTPDLLDRFPGQVSDGQLQRAAVARTLAAHPRYLICDEMTAMLDAANAAAVVHVIREFTDAGGGVLLISHDHKLLTAVCDDIAELTPDGIRNIGVNSE